MGPRSIALGALVLMTQATVARPAIGTLDVVPAATLLVPWFDIDPNRPDGVATIIYLSTATPEPALARVTLWTDVGIPTLSFNVFLTGYDAQAVSLDDVFDGQLPVTAPLNLDPSDVVSPRGDLSLDGSVFGCGAADFPSNVAEPELDAEAVQALRFLHEGQPAAGSGRCSSMSFDDGHLRGYVTIDVVNACSPLGPADAGYFVQGGGGVASNDNVLVGEVRYVDALQNFAWGDVAVHLEADALDPRTGAPGQYTFYGRLVSWTAADNREPLATRWAVPTPNQVDLRLVVWRDPKVVVQPFSCGSPTAVAAAGSWLSFDMAEDGLDISALVPRLHAAQTVRLGHDLTLPWRAGWLMIDLSHTVAGAGAPAHFDATQGLVGVVGTLAACGGEGRFIGGYHAVALDNASAPGGPSLGDLPVVSP